MPGFRIASIKGVLIQAGMVLALTHVHTKPGMFNAYIHDLNANWRRSMEAQVEAGHVVSYGMYTVVFPREGEPSEMLLQELKFKD
jgi:hypothetical protein